MYWIKASPKMFCAFVSLECSLKTLLSSRAPSRQEDDGVKEFWCVGLGIQHDACMQFVFCAVGTSFSLLESAAACKAASILITIFWVSLAGKHIAVYCTKHKWYSTGKVKAKLEHTDKDVESQSSFEDLCVSLTWSAGICKDRTRVHLNTPVVLWQLSTSSLLSCSIIRASLCPINPANHCYGWWMHKHYTHLALASGYETVSTSCRRSNLTEGKWPCMKGICVTCKHMGVCGWAV